MRTVRALLNATARTQAASPKRNNDSFPRMLAAVAAASVVTTSRPGIRNWPFTEATPSKMPRTAAILARKRGDISVIRCVMKSQRAAIATQLNCRDDKTGTDQKTDPKSRRGQKSSRSQLGQQVNRNAPMHLEIERRVARAEQAVLQHRREETRVEGDLFKNADHEWRQDRPEKCRAPRDSRNQQRPAVNRRVPERDHGQAVKQDHQFPEQVEVFPGRSRETARQQHRAADEQHKKLRDSDDYENNRRQNRERNDRLGKDSREVRDRQRFPKQNAAIAAFAVKRVKAVEETDNKRSHDEHHRHNVIGQLDGRAPVHFIKQHGVASASRQMSRAD